MNKRDDLNCFLDTCEADIVLLTETWLSSTTNNHELFTCEKAYTVYRADRGQRVGGGVLIAVSADFNSSVIDVQTDLEVLWINIDCTYKKLILGVCYRSPSSSKAFVDELHDIINKIIIRFPFQPVFLDGDFNYPQIHWPSMHTQVTLPNECRKFLEMCSDFNLCQLVTQATRVSFSSCNILDLILTTASDLVSSVCYSEGLSDHCFLNFHISISAKRVRKRTKMIRDSG